MAVVKSIKVLVTGASSGIGEATAKLLHSQGYTVYASARDVNNLAALKEAGINVVELDLTEDKSIAMALAKTGPIDILVNNAGYGSYGAFEEVAITEARRQFEVNIFGVARLTQLTLPHMRQEKAGMIINIGSIGGRFGEAYGSWYHASKYALEGLSDSLALELKQFNINVVLIEPGLIKTNWWAMAAKQMRLSSHKQAYKTDLDRKARRFISISKSRYASDPAVVAKKIAKLIHKPKLRYRYAVGGGAKSILFSRHLLGDRLFYRLTNKS